MRSARKLDGQAAAPFGTVPSLAVDHYDRIAGLHADVQRAEAAAVRAAAIARTLGRRLCSAGIAPIAIAVVGIPWIARLLIWIRLIRGRMRLRLLRRPRRQRLADGLDKLRV